MKTRRDIKTAIDRNIKALELKPALGRMTKKTVARLTDGITCQISDGGWSLTADWPENLGGNNTGPTPGAFARMALGSCLAMGYGLWLAQTETPYDDIQVEVEGDVDYSGLFGIDPHAPVGHEELRVRVSIVSPAPPADIQRVVEKADRLSPLLHLIGQPIPVKRELALTAPVAPAPARRQA